MKSDNVLQPVDLYIVWCYAIVIYLNILLDYINGNSSPAVSMFQTDSFSFMNTTYMWLMSFIINMRHLDRHCHHHV